jgi:small subunit ribosomal protein S6
VKRYEGLFILNTTGKEEGLKESIDKISNEIVSAGGKVETIQKMDKRAFTRITDKKVTSGFFVNVIFETNPASISQLRSKFGLSEDVYRVIFTNAPTAKPVAA